MRSIVQFGIIAIVAACMAPASTSPVTKPASPEINIGGLHLTPDEVVSLSVMGPSLAASYVWTNEEAERAKGAEWRTLTRDYPNRLLELYTDKGFLVIKWNRWQSPERPHDAGRVDVYTLINLSRIVYANVNVYAENKYHLTIKLAKPE